MVCFPLFIILTIVHGSDTWLNYGFPLGSITVGISLLIYLFFWVKKLILQCKGHFKISKVEVDDNSSYRYLRLKRPKNYKHIEGQYVFLSYPDVSGTQWHPFSICSSEFSPYVSFLIKNSGDFTGKLIKKFKECIDSNSRTETLTNLKKMKGIKNNKGINTSSMMKPYLAEKQTKHKNYLSAK